MKPLVRPRNPDFSSGPCAKRPGWTLGALEGALLGRSHRAKPGRAKLDEVVARSRAVLGIPKDYRLAVVPASDTGAVEIGRLDVPLFAERFDLRGGAVHEHHANVQRAQHGDIEEDVAEIFIGDDGAIDFNNEGFFPELRDVLQNAAQVGQFHFTIFLCAK